MWGPEEECGGDDATACSAISTVTAQLSKNNAMLFSISSTLDQEFCIARIFSWIECVVNVRELKKWGFGGLGF